MAHSALASKAALAAFLLCFAAAPPALAQSIKGKVVLAGWSEPVAAARVQLLGPDMGPLSTTRTDDSGRFDFAGLRPGVYYVQALHGDNLSSLEGPLELDAEEEQIAAELTMRSVLFERALSCFEEERPRTTGILAGMAYDADSQTPLPGARILIEWRGERGERARREARTDGGGRYVVCDVPSSTGLSVWIQALGQAGPRQEGVVLDPGALARFDVPVELRRSSSVRVVDSSRDLRPDAAATLEGRLLDAETGSPIAAAVVQLGDLGIERVTDDDGRFRFSDVAPGRHAFHVSRLGYDWESSPVEVGEGARVVLELHAAPEAVALEAVIVRATTVETRMARGATQAPRVLAGVELRRAEERTTSVTQTIRQFPSLHIREGRFESTDGVEYGVCVESSRALQRYAIPEQQTTLPWCEMIAIVVDGVATIRGSEAIHMMRLREIESIEFLPPLGAMQWGERAAVNGALVIWTRGRGPHRSGARDELRPDR